MSEKFLKEEIRVLEAENKRLKINLGLYNDALCNIDQIAMDDHRQYNKGIIKILKKLRDDNIQDRIH